MTHTEDCESCKLLLDEYGEENLEICEFCGHYYVQYKDNSGYCTCTKGEEKFQNEFVMCMNCQRTFHKSVCKPIPEHGIGFNYCIECTREIEGHRTLHIGHCPFCDSDDVEYGLEYIENVEVIFPMLCHICYKISRECYDMEYRETIGCGV